MRGFGQEGERGGWHRPISSSWPWLLLSGPACQQPNYPQLVPVFRLNISSWFCRVLRLLNTQFRYFSNPWLLPKSMSSVIVWVLAPNSLAHDMSSPNYPHPGHTYNRTCHGKGLVNCNSVIQSTISFSWNDNQTSLHSTPVSIYQEEQ